MLPLYSYFKVLPLLKLIHLQQANFMYGFHNNILPINFHSYYNRPTHMHNTRYSTSNYTLPSLSTKTNEKSIKLIGPRTWAG